MTVLLAPPAGERPSGGYRYNRRVAELAPPEAELLYRETELQALGALVASLRELRKPSAAVPGGEKGHGGAAGGKAAAPFFIFDSLYLTEPAELLALIRSFAGLSYGLLIHLLPDQDAAASPDAQGGLQLPESVLSQSVRRLLEEASLVLTTSEFMRSTLRANLQAAPRILVCRPGIDASPRETTPTRESRGKAADPERRGTVRLLSVSNDTETKNLSWLAHRLGELRTTQPWEWHVVGALDRLNEAVDDAGIAERTYLHGAASAEELAAQLDAADALLHPSRFESYGMVLAEAVAAGVPVLANRVGGVPEVLRDRREGRLLGIDAGAEWRKALSDIIDRPAEREAYRAACLERRSAFPDWSRVARCLTEAVEAARAETERRHDAAGGEEERGAHGRGNDGR